MKDYLPKKNNDILEPKPSRKHKYCGVCKLTYTNEEYIAVNINDYFY